MSDLYVNGIQRELPLSGEKPFQDLIGFARSHIATDTSLISSICVDGIELSEEDEAKLAQVPIQDFKRVEIRTASRRELAEETLQYLIAFSSHLEKLSHDSAVLHGQPSFVASFRKLIDGITLFSESLLGAKEILRIGPAWGESAGPLQVVRVLEAELLSILKDLLSCQEDQAMGSYMQDLLDQDLPANFRQWREEAIPAIIRSRDS